MKNGEYSPAFYSTSRVRRNEIRLEIQNNKPRSKIHQKQEDKSLMHLEKTLSPKRSKSKAKTKPAPKIEDSQMSDNYSIDVSDLKTIRKKISVLEKKIYGETK